MNLNLLRELVRVREELRRGPSTGGLKRFELLKFMGAGNCPECGEELDLGRYRRRISAEAIHESISCSGCGASFELTEAALN
jgi:hypothetical protein